MSRDGDFNRVTSTSCKTRILLLKQVCVPNLTLFCIILIYTGAAVINYTLVHKECIENNSDNCTMNFDPLAHTTLTYIHTVNDVYFNILISDISHHEGIQDACRSKTYSTENGKLVLRSGRSFTRWRRFSGTNF